MTTFMSEPKPLTWESLCAAVVELQSKPTPDRYMDTDIVSPEYFELLVAEGFIDREGNRI